MFKSNSSTESSGPVIKFVAPQESDVLNVPLLSLSSPLLRMETAPTESPAFQPTIQDAITKVNPPVNPWNGMAYNTMLPYNGDLTNGDLNHYT